MVGRWLRLESRLHAAALPCTERATGFPDTHSEYASALHACLCPGRAAPRRTALLDRCNAAPSQQCSLSSCSHSHPSLHVLRESRLLSSMSRNESQKRQRATILATTIISLNLEDHRRSSNKRRRSELARWALIGERSVKFLHCHQPTLADLGQFVVGD